MIDLGLRQTFWVTLKQKGLGLSCWVINPFPQVPSPARRSSTTTRGRHTWPWGRTCGSPNSSAVPPDHPTASLAPCWAAVHLEETQQAEGTHAAQEMLFPSLSVPGQPWGWTDASACWLFNAISISKALSEKQWSVFKELFSWLQALTCPETLAEIGEACVFRLCKSESCLILPWSPASQALSLVY